MRQNPFFDNKGPLTFDKIIKKNDLKVEIDSSILNNKIYDFKNLTEASNKNITFFHSIKYKSLAKSTKAFACITREELASYLPEECIKIITKNVLLVSAKITEQFYPDSITDNNNYEVKENFKKKFIKKDKANYIFFKRAKNKNYFNLNKYIHFQLKSLNIKKIDIINKDTFNAKNNFFSARRSISHNENDYGRNISIIMIN